VARLLGRGLFRRRRPPPGASPGTLVMPESAVRPVIRIMDYGPGAFEEKTLATPAEIRPYLDDQSVTWVDVEGLGDEQVLREIGDIFGLHPLALEDVVHIPQRPKTESYDTHEFIVTQMVMLHQDGVLETEQVSIFLGRNYVLTFQERPGDCFDPVRERIRRGKGVSRQRGPDYLAYALLDAIIDNYFPALEAFGERIEAIEDEVVANPSRKTIHGIYEVKRDLLALRRAIWPQRDAINSLLRAESDLISPAVRVYMRDCYDHAVQIMDVVETYRELAMGLVDVYLSSVSNRMNEVMKVLTIIATLFIPLTFIVGIYGMNFQYMPELHWRWGYATVWGVMGATALAMLYYFRRRRWMG